MRTFNLEYQIIVKGEVITGTQQVKGLLFMTAAYKLQRQLKKAYSSSYGKGVNVFINLNDQSKYER